mgnify:CR=1 FL=1
MSDHCWHHCGFVYDTYPSQHDEKCCRCGKVREVRGVFDVPGGHGSHVDVREIREVAEDVGPCEGASR